MKDTDQVHLSFHYFPDQTDVPKNLRMEAGTIRFFDDTRAVDSAAPAAAAAAAAGRSL